MKKYLFWKSTFAEKIIFFEKVVAVQKYLLQKSNCFVDIFILNKFFMQKGSCSDKVLS